jgi:hypothetical protein
MDFLYHKGNVRSTAMPVYLILTVIQISVRFRVILVAMILTVNRAWEKHAGKCVGVKQLSPILMKILYVVTQELLVILRMITPTVPQAKRVAFMDAYPVMTRLMLAVLLPFW